MEIGIRRVETDSARAEKSIVRGSRMRFFYKFGLVLTVEGRAERSVCSCTDGNIYWEEL